MSKLTIPPGLEIRLKQLFNDWRYFYVRSKFPRQRIGVLAFGIKSVTADPDSTLIRVSGSRCSARDQFSRDRGVVLALRRLTSYSDSVRCPLSHDSVAYIIRTSTPVDLVARSGGVIDMERLEFAIGKVIEWARDVAGIKKDLSDLALP